MVHGVAVGLATAARRGTHRHDFLHDRFIHKLVALVIHPFLERDVDRVPVAPGMADVALCTRPGKEVVSVLVE